ncbi:MAG: DNA recombination protein RmuC [Pseudomonadota bacterium]
MQIAGITLPPTMALSEAALAVALALGLGLVLGLVLGAVALWRLALAPARDAAAGTAQRLAAAERALAAAEVRAEDAATRREETERLRTALADAWAEHAATTGTLEAERRGHAAERATWCETEARLTADFRTIAAETLDANAERFLALVSERHAAHAQETGAAGAAREQAVQALVAPLAQELRRFEARVGEIEQARTGAYAALHAETQAMRALHQNIGTETRRLVQALRAPKARGRWGEMQLARVFEMAGMLEHVDVATEASLPGGDGLLRPDAVVRLPGGRHVVVDAKTPLDGYLAAIEAGESAAADTALAAHVRQVRAHVRALSAKAYWTRLPATPELVVMFLPGEGIAAAAMERAPGLFDEALQARVLIATPTTLIALVKAIAHGWREARLADNARAIADTGRALHARLASMGNHVTALGQSLRQSVERYNATVGALERRVLPAARRFETLGAASGTDGRLPTPDAARVEIDAALPTAPELSRRRTG